MAARFSERALPKFREDQPLKKEPPDFDKTFCGLKLRKIRSFSPRRARFQPLLSKIQFLSDRVRNLSGREFFLQNPRTFQNFSAALPIEKFRKENLDPGEIQAFKIFQSVDLVGKFLKASIACNNSFSPTRIFSNALLSTGFPLKIRKENLHPGEGKVSTNFVESELKFEPIGPKPFYSQLAVVKGFMLSFGHNFSKFYIFLSPIPYCLAVDKVPKTNKENLDPGIFCIPNFWIA